MTDMVTVWDIRNEKWVNIPKRWMGQPNAKDLWAKEKPKEAPVKATTKKEAANA